MADDGIRKPEEESTASKVGGFLSRVGEGLVDGLAKSKPIIGMPLQYAFNTEEHQAQQAQRELAKQRISEWNADAERRKLERENGLREQKALAEQSDLYKNKANALNEAAKTAIERNRAEQATIPFKRDAEIARNALAQEQADNQFKTGRIADLSAGLRTELASDPGFAAMSFKEQDALVASPRIQAMLEGKFYLSELQGIASGDRSAVARMGRTISRRGWSLVDSSNDGIKYLDMGGGRRIAATRENIVAMNKKIHDAALEELRIRTAISDAATLGDSLKRSIAQRTISLLPYNGNDATASYRQVQGIFSRASEKEQGYHLFNQAIKDFQSSGLPTSAKLAGLQKCLPFLQKMGYAVEGLDPKNPDVNAVRIIDLNDKRQISFSEFGKICEQNDTLGKRLDDFVAKKQWSALQAKYGAGADLALQKAQRQAAGTQAKKAKTQDAGDENAPNAEHEDLKKAFGISYEKLPVAAQEKMQEQYRKFNDMLRRTLTRSGKRKFSDIPTEELNNLDAAWKEMLSERDLDSKTFYSPVDSLLKNRRKTELIEKKTEAERTARKSEEFAEDWENTYHGAYDDSPGEAFRRNYRRSADRASANRIAEKADKENAKIDLVLKSRGLL